MCLSYGLVQFADPDCLTYSGSSFDLCTNCNIQTNSVLIVLSPMLTICGSYNQENKQCSFNLSNYNGLSNYSNLTLIPFYSGDNLLYCRPQDTMQGDSSCIKYKNLGLKQKWQYEDSQSAELFDFGEVRDQISSETVGSYCQICPKGMRKQMQQLDSSGYYKIECQSSTQCSYWQYVDSQTTQCKDCNDLFSNCLACNQSTCLVCPLGFYFNPSVYDYRTNSYKGKCVFGYCPVGSCLSIQSTTCTPSNLSQCNRCYDQMDGSQVCQECVVGYYLSINGSCIVRSTGIDQQNRFLSYVPSTYLTNSSFNVSPGYSIEYPAYSFHQIIHDKIELLNNNTYSSANFNIYLFKGTHYLFSCTGSIQEESLFQQYPQLTNFCDILNLQRTYSITDQIKVAVIPLSCSLKSSLGYTSANGTFFDSVCVNYANDVNPIVVVNNQYSYFNVTGSWAFYNITFDGANSMVADQLGYADYSILPTSLCGVVSQPTGYDGFLDIQTVGNISSIGQFTYECKDSYVPRKFPRQDNYKCFENQGHRVKQSVESSLRCGRTYDKTDYFFQNDQGIYTKRQRTLFNLYQFAPYQSVNVSVPTLTLQGCIFRNFYGAFDSLINIEMGSLSSTLFNGKYFYFYSGSYTGGAISIQKSNFNNSRFCRGAIYFRKMTYDIDYSMSLTNLTLLNRDTINYPQLQYQYLQLNNVTDFNFHSFSQVGALARYGRKRVYQFINENVYQPVMLLRPLHVGIFVNLEDYPGSVLITNSNFANNMHYISEFNNTLTYMEENQKINDFIEYFGNSEEKAEYKMAICNENLNQSRSLFGHAFKNQESYNTDQNYDVFERLSLVYISRNWGLIYIANNSFINNTGTFGGALSINTPLFSKNWYVLPEIYMIGNKFSNNFAYLGGGAVYLRFAINKTQSKGCGDGVIIQMNDFTNNLVSKLGNGGAMSAYCLYLDQSDQLEESSYFNVSYNYQIQTQSETLQISQPIEEEINDDTICQQSQDIFSNLDTKTAFQIINNNNFIKNMAGNNGSALYLFQITYPLLESNNFYYNTAINSWYERQFSPFYKYLTQGIPFTFYDQIYGYTDDYDFIIENNNQTNKTSFNFEYTNVKGAVHIYFCQESYCLQNVIAESLLYLLNFEGNQVGPQFSQTFYDGMTSSLYISGGSNTLIQSCSFINHNNSYINFFDKFANTSYYDLIYNQTRYAQGSIISFIIDTDLLSEYIGQALIQINLCNFANNVHQQIIQTDTETDNYFKGQLIKFKTNQHGQTTNYLTIFEISQSQFTNNIFYGNMTSQIYIEEGLFNCEGNSFTSIGQTESDPENPLQQQYGVFYVNNSITYSYTVPPTILLLSENYFYDISSIQGTIAYLYVANQFFVFENNAYLNIQCSDKAIFVLQDRYSISRNLIVNNQESYLVIKGRILYTFNDNQPKTQSSIVFYKASVFVYIYCIQEGTVMYVQDLYGFVIFGSQSFVGYQSDWFNYWQYQFCNLIYTFPLEISCPYYILSENDPYVILQNSQKENLYQFYLENIGDIYDQDDYAVYEDFILRNVENTIGLSILNQIWYSQMFGSSYTNVTMCWNKASFYELWIRPQQIDNLGGIITYNSHINYGSFANLNDEQSLQAFYFFSLKVGSLISINQNSTFYFKLTKVDFINLYSQTSLFYVEDSYFNLNLVEITRDVFYDATLFKIMGKSNVFVSNVNCEQNQGSFQFIYASGSDYQNQINITFTNCKFMQNIDEAYNFFYLYYTNFTSNFNMFSQLIASNVFQGFQSQLYFLNTNFTCQALAIQYQQETMYECKPNVLTGYFYIANQTSLTFDSCIFDSIPGLHSTVINATGGTISIVNSSIINCSTSIHDSGVLSFTQISSFGMITITGSNFLGNTRDIYSSSSWLNLQQNYFQNGFQFFIYLEYSNLTILHNEFDQLSSSRIQSDSAIYCNCQNLTAEHNSFSHLEGYAGGALYFNQYKNDISTIKGNYFRMNSAYYGGSIYIQSATTILLNQNSFYQNRALNGNIIDSGSGGALFIECSNLNEGISDQGSQTICQFNGSTNTFDSNFAENQGGAIMQQTSLNISQIQIGKFINNNATYGPNIAKYASKILITSLSSEQLTIFNSNTSYTDYLSSLNITNFTNFSSGDYLDLQVTIYDSYNQRVSANSVSSASISTSVFNQNSAVINNGKVDISNGQYVFTDLQVLINPGSNQTLQLTLFSLEVYNHYGDAPFAYYSIPLYIQARKCNIGEEWAQNNTCRICDNQTYLLTDNFQNVTLCKPCPIGGNCEGGSGIYALNNYQRSEFVPDLFLQCNITGVCLAGNSTYPNGLCAEGYSGKLCTECTRGYSRQNQFQCTSCPNMIQNIIQIAFIGLLAVIYIAVMVHSTSQSQEVVKPLYSVLVKIITNHLQVFSSMSIINLQLPNLIQSYFNDSQKIYFFDRMISLDCFINTTQINIPIFFIKLIFIGLLPVFLILGNTIFWSIYYFLKTKSKLNFKTLLTKFLNSLVIMLYLVHPSITQFVFQTFNCTNLDFQTRLVQDYSILCYQNQHKFFIITVVLPSIIVWVFGIPFLFTLMTIRFTETIKKMTDLMKSDYEMQKTEERFKQLQSRLGFLLNGYKKQSYLWEITIMVRKTLILMISVFFSIFSPEAQMLGVLLILILSIHLQINFKPYIHESVNKLELISLIALSVNLYICLHYKALYHANYTDNQTLDFCMLFLLILPNVVFLYYWLYYMRRELIRELYKRKLYTFLPFVTCRRFSEDKFFKLYLRKDRQFKQIVSQGGGLLNIEVNKVKLLNIWFEKYTSVLKKQKTVILDQKSDKQDQFQLAKNPSQIQKQKTTILESRNNDINSLFDYTQSTQKEYQQYLSTKNDSKNDKKTQKNRENYVFSKFKITKRKAKQNAEDIESAFD